MFPSFRRMLLEKLQVDMDLLNLKCLLHNFVRKDTISVHNVNPLFVVINSAYLKSSCILQLPSVQNCERCYSVQM